MRRLPSIAVFLVALAPGYVAYRLFVRCIIPWWKESSAPPSRVHTSLSIAGIQFSGGQMLVPFIAFLLLTATIAFVGLMLFTAKHTQTS